MSAEKTGFARVPCHADCASANHRRTVGVAWNASESCDKVAFSGKDEVRSGQHVASFRIVASYNKSGADIFIGVVDSKAAEKAVESGTEVAYTCYTVRTGMTT